MPDAIYLLVALIWASQNAVQSFKLYVDVRMVRSTGYVETVKDAAGNALKGDADHDATREVAVAAQTLPMRPAVLQAAIKRLGTNGGGGFFNVNSASPFKAPTPLSNFLELLAILLISAALCETFGRMAGGDRCQGKALPAAMLAIFVPLLLARTFAEQAAPRAVWTRGGPARFRAAGLWRSSPPDGP